MEFREYSQHDTAKTISVATVDNAPAPACIGSLAPLTSAFRHWVPLSFTFRVSWLDRIRTAPCCKARRQNQQPVRFHFVNPSLFHKRRKLQLWFSCDWTLFQNKVVSFRGFDPFLDILTLKRVFLSPGGDTRASNPEPSDCCSVVSTHAAALLLSLPAVWHTMISLPSLCQGAGQKCNATIGH